MQSIVKRLSRFSGKYHRELRVGGNRKNHRKYHGASRVDSHGKIDLRSDTVTKPSNGMLEAMLEAKVGDDVYKEDPTVNELEERCAQLFGLERALFVPSGTMGNLLAIMSHVKGRGEELIIGASQHIYIYEQVHFSQLAGIPARVLPNQKNGTIAMDDIKRHIFDASDAHMCETKLICLENTHMRSGGTPLPLDYLQNVTAFAHSNNINVHLDGARLYNAAVAYGLPLSKVLHGVDSVSMCFSKGLGCPVGSVVAGKEQLIKQALRNRKMLGGGMRQAGILAAAGLYALKHAEEQFLEDHSKMRCLANGIASLDSDWFRVDMDRVKTNILFVNTRENMAQDIVKRLSARHVLCSAFSPSTLRFVTHLDVSMKDIETAIDAIHSVNKDLN